jgi:hypothetical protein
VLCSNWEMLPWRSLHQWHGLNGIYLPQDDLLHHVASTFGSEGPPQKTQAFWDIALHNRPPEEAELADLIDLLKHKTPSPSCDVATTATGSPSSGFNDRKKADASIVSAWRRAAIFQSATTLPRMACRSSTRNARESSPSGHFHPAISCRRSSGQQALIIAPAGGRLS